MTKTQIPTGHRIAKFEKVVTVADGSTCVATVWVLLGPPPAITEGDYTMPEVTHRYFTRHALVAAIENGTAWL